MRIVQNVVRWFSADHRLIAPAVIRVGLGVVMLSLYLLHYSHRHFLWGPNAFVPHQLFLELSDAAESWSLYRFADTTLGFELVFHAGILVTLLWVAGFVTRVTGPLTYVWAFSLFARNGYLLDGGDNMMIIVLFYLMFCRTDAYLSVARLWRSERYTGPVATPVASSRWWSPIPVVLHNMALVAIVVQLAFLYGTSGLTKVQGEMWQSGVALYYVLRVQEFTLPGVAHYIYENAWLVVVASYVTVLEQVAYPFMLLNKYAKRISVFMVIQMHLGIAVLMGLITFSTVMITLQIATFSDDEILGGVRLLNRAVARVRERILALGGRLRIPGRMPVPQPVAGTVRAN